MGNVNLPTPVALTGGALCVLGGYLLAVVIGPDTSSRTTATVDSYDEDSSLLCLQGDGVLGEEGAVDDGVLCGTWRRTPGNDAIPEQGDQFRFVSLNAGGNQGPDGQRPATVIYGEVVR